MEPNADCLNRYLNELQYYDTLDAREEKALARDIERLEVAHWQALLSYRPALEEVASALLSVLPKRARKLEALRRLSRSMRGSAARDPRWQHAVAAAARELRRLDVDRTARKTADAAAHRAFGQDRRARHYLARVDRCRKEQERAKEKFVTANLRLVVAMAGRYDRSLLPLPDLIQEGNFGLMRAVERFDHRRGFRFSTYASWWIRHSLNRALSDKARLVRVPVHTLDALSRVGRAHRAISSKTGEPATAQELAEHTGLPEEKLATLNRQSQTLIRPTSLDRSVGEDQDQTLYDLMPAPEEDEPEELLDMASWREQVDGLLDQLSPIKAAIIRYRFGIDDAETLTLREIGDKYNLSRERIRQLEGQALRDLRAAMGRSSSRRGAHGKDAA